MALDLFKRVESRKGLFAVEKITLIYNLLTSILILFMFQRMDHPLHMLWDRAVIAAMTFLLMYLYRLAPCKFSAFVGIRILSSSTASSPIWIICLLRPSSGCSADSLPYGSVMRFRRCG